VGGVSGRAGAKAGESNLSATVIPSRDVAVKDILVFWKAAPFAGRRQNEDLGRSGSRAAVSPAASSRADDSGCPKGAEEGNAVSMRATKRMHPSQAREIVASAQGTRPSLGPSTRARRSSLCSAAKASEVGRSLRHHGWANSGNREEPTLGLGRTDVARLATCHRFRKEEAWHDEEKDGGRGLPPCED
jgi:hypothetical protein